MQYFDFQDFLKFAIFFLVESSNKIFTSKWLRFHHLISLLTFKSPKEYLLTYGSYVANRSEELRMLCFEWSLQAQIKSNKSCDSYACSKLGAIPFHWSRDVLIVSFQSLRKKVCGVHLTGTLAFSGPGELLLFHQLVLICILERYVNSELSTRPTLTIKGPPYSILKGSHQCVQFKCTCI